MDTEFHYWMTGLIANRAGFTEEESKVIAYSSEYIDENDVSLTIKSKKGGSDYNNFVSQTMNILKPKGQLIRIYPIFHFIPGEPDAETARRRDGKMHLLNTTPNSPNANEFIDDAFKSSEDIRLYRIGIASHGFVDTWAHQNFVGYFDSFNNIGLDPKPDIGHADAEHHPDWVSHFWVDNRLVQSDVSNRDRFLAAAQALFAKYCGYLKVHSQIDNSESWEDVANELVNLMGPTHTGNTNKYHDVRIRGYQDKIKWLGNEFDERIWFDAAIDEKIHGMKDSLEGLPAKFTIFRDEYFWHDEENRENTDWYRFSEAVKEHEQFAIKVLTPTFRKIGINLAVA